MNNKIRNICSAILAKSLILSGLTEKAKKEALRGDFIISIYFHNPDKSLFEFCVKWLKKNKFIFLSEKDIFAIAKNEITFPKGGVILTVDDGWQSNEKNVIAVADKHKVPVTIFVTTDAVINGNFWWSYIPKARQSNPNLPSIEKLKKISNQEREKILVQTKNEITIERQALNLDQLKKASLSEYVTIGAHTVNHPILVNCDDNEAFLEIEGSKVQIQEWLNTQVESFAYPNGDYSSREIEFLKQLNFSTAYTTEPAYLTKERLQKIYQLPRFCIFEGISKAEAICRMTGVWQRFF